MLKKTIAAVVAVLWMGMASSADASTVSFANNNFPAEPGGTLTFSTAPAGTLNVTNAVISSVVNNDTFVGTTIDDIGIINCGILGSFGCLNFQTGAFVSSNGVDTATYAAGGFLTITGEAVGVAGAGTVLYTSTFSQPVTIVLTGTQASVQGTLIGGTIDPFLAAFLGVLPTPLDGTANSTAINVQLTFNTTGNVTGGSGTIILSDVTLETVDSPGDNPVPEPGSMLLLGTGLFGLAASARRRLRGKR